MSFSVLFFSSLIILSSLFPLFPLFPLCYSFPPCFFCFLSISPLLLLAITVSFLFLSCMFTYSFSCHAQAGIRAGDMRTSDSGISRTALPFPFTRVGRCTRLVCDSYEFQYTALFLSVCSKGCRRNTEPFANSAVIL